MKTCKYCEEAKPRTPEFFHRDKAQPDGLHPYCKVCKCAWNSQHRLLPNLEAKKKLANYRRKNRERLRREARLYYGRNKEAQLQRNALREARKRGATTGEKISRREIYKRDKGICYLCSRPVRFTGMHLDHVIPLSKGGAHTPGNVRCTHATCNLKKQNKEVARAHS